MIDDKMLILGRPGSSGAAAWLRLESHLNAMDRRGLAFCPVLQQGDDEDLAWKAMNLADVFVSCAAGSTFLHEMVRKWTSRGKPWVWDLDDDPVNISPYNPAYQVFGTSEVKIDPPVNGQEWLWRNGVGGFDAGRNTHNQDIFLKMLRENITAVSTTTAYLGTKLERLFPDTPIYVRPNVLDFEEMWTETKRNARDEHVRIIYQGGSSHYADLNSVLPALAEIAKAYKHVRFLFLGDTKAHAAKVIPEDRIEEFEWTFDYRTFALRMARLCPDIAIAPLCMDEDHAEFNRCKSPLKWLDAAAVSVPCVCQWDTPYQEVISFDHGDEDNWTGLLATDANEWFYSLSMLIENPDMRDHIGANAYREVYRNWNADVSAPTYLREYEDILNGHHHTLNT